MRARDLIDRFGREEDAFLRAEFLAPVARRGRIRVRIAGVTCELEVKSRPKGFSEGWAILKARSHREADVVRAAGPADVKRYLALFPRARLVAAALHGDTWLGLPASAPEKGIRISGLVPIALAPSVELFQTAVVRFDGRLFLLESSEKAATAAWLREALAAGTRPDSLRRKGLTAPERDAYEIQWKLREEMLKPEDQRRLESALQSADAELITYAAKQDLLTVRYKVDGQEFESIVSRGDLSVVSAGICLDGTDGMFDLTSLVGVMRQAAERGELD